MRAAGWLTFAGLAALGAGWWMRRHPSACPYALWPSIAVPHPLITRARLAEALAPRSGERLLEVGPGTGHYTLDVAQAVGPSGSLDVLDLQQEMLDHTMRAAAVRGLANVRPARGDARRLPYADDAFDGAFLVTTLGEIGDPDAALRELARVVRPGGRVVVGELIGDPHMVTPGALRRRGEAAGLRPERRVGPWAGSYTVLRVPR